MSCLLAKIVIFFFSNIIVHQELRAKVAKHTERHITTLMHACDALVDLTSMSSDTGNGCNDVDFGTAGTWVVRYPLNLHHSFEPFPFFREQ